jgi:tRNA A-37 threonylcarbamoyl transferase component Bud32
MQQVKDTLRATVRIGYDGRVHKTFRGPQAQERFANEVRVLRYLESRGCPFVPRLLDADPECLKIVTTSCGSRVEHLDEERMREIYAELEEYGVRHEDAELRNVTYRQSDGRFCLIDFEFASILNESPDDRAAVPRPDTHAVVRLDGPGASQAE